MRDLLIMSARERKRKVIMESVIKGDFSLKEGAEQMGVTYRHANRIKQRYLTYGDAGLVHQSRGVPSGRAKPEDFKEMVLELYERDYLGFGPTYASELMYEENNVEIHPETLRLWTKAEGLWARKRKRKPYRKRREAKTRFGELLQIDGSDHHWFGPDKPRSCLIYRKSNATSLET